MSIIYDALKKVEISGANEAKEKIKKSVNPKPKNYLLYALIACAVVFIANIFYDRLFQDGPVKMEVSGKKANLLTDTKSAVSAYSQQSKNESASLLSLERKAEPLREAESPLILNGVFFSDKEGYALINNRIVKEGDKIEGATVVRITLDEVGLERDSSIIKLSTNTK